MAKLLEPPAKDTDETSEHERRDRPDRHGARKRGPSHMGPMVMGGIAAILCAGALGGVVGAAIMAPTEDAAVAAEAVSSHAAPELNVDPLPMIGEGDEGDGTADETTRTSTNETDKRDKRDKGTEGRTESQAAPEPEDEPEASPEPASEPAESQAPATTGTQATPPQDTGNANVTNDAPSTSPVSPASISTEPLTWDELDGETLVLAKDPTKGLSVSVDGDVMRVRVDEMDPISVAGKTVDISGIELTGRIDPQDPTGTVTLDTAPVVSRAAEAAGIDATIANVTAALAGGIGTMSATPTDEGLRLCFSPNQRAAAAGLGLIGKSMDSEMPDLDAYFRL